jgi:hypothetical protein
VLHSATPVFITKPMKRKSLICILSLLTLLSSSTFGQFPIIQTPQPANMPTVPNYTPQTNNNPNNPNIPNIPNYPTQNRNNQLDIYEQDRRTIERRDAELKSTLNQYAASGHGIQYDFPSQANEKGTEIFRKSAKLLNDMMNGTVPINLRDAVFSVENAYFGGKLEYNKYTKAIQSLIATAKLKTQQDGNDWNNPLTRNVMLFRVMADTLKIKQPKQETTSMSYPLRYDFDDPWGKKEWSKMFVSKLLSTKTGQCHSMPLLYLIMCEATNTNANLAFSPMHSYIKFKDPNNEWQNLELTNGHIVTDAFIIGSGFVTSEALKNKIYLQPQTKKQVILECLADLVWGYICKFGFDEFAKQNISAILKNDPNFLQALLIKSNYESARFNYVAEQLGRPPMDTIKAHYPRAYKLHEERKKTYKQTDDLGYREMPPEAYQDWLKSMDKELKKQQEEKLIRQIQTTK